MSAGVVQVDIGLPASEPVQLFEPEGSPDGLDRWGSVLLQASGRFDEFADEAQEIRGMSGWSGEGSISYAEATGRAVRQARRTGRSARRVARVVLAVADRLRDHQRTYQDHVERKRRLDNQLEELTAACSTGAEISLEQIGKLKDDAATLAQKYERLVEDDRRLRRIATTDQELLVDSFESANSLEEVHAVDGGRADIAQDAMRRPGAPDEGVSAEQVRQWWKGLSPAERRAVISSYPFAIAAAEGVPTWGRELAVEIRDEEQEMRLRSKKRDGTIDEEESERLRRVRQRRQD